MQRLFAGTPWDRSPTCERCGKLDPECACPPPLPEPVRLAPEAQTARLRLEKRAKGKLMTVVGNLDPNGNDLAALATRFKTTCGVGGTVKEGRIELQGDCVAAVAAVLGALGYRTRRG